MKFVCIPSIQKQLCKFALSQLPKQGGMPCVLCPKQGNKMEGVVLNRVCILRIFCPKQGQGLKPTLSGSPIPKYWSSNTSESKG